MSMLMNMLYYTMKQFTTKIRTQYFLFTDEDIENYRNGTYPSTNWYDEAFKKSAFEQMHNLSISGGSEKTTYNASIGYTNQGGLTR